MQDDRRKFYRSWELTRNSSKRNLTGKAGVAVVTFITVCWLFVPTNILPGNAQNAGPKAMSEPPGTSLAVQDSASFLVPEGTVNLAKGKSVISSVQSPITGNLAQITDGEKDASDIQVVEMRKGLQWIQIDLEKICQLYAIVIWHDHRFVQIFHDVVVQVSNDAEFNRDVQTLFNNDQDNSAGLGAGKDREYFETNRGKLVDAKGIRARYVRLYSRGSHLSALNCYTEIEIYGMPFGIASGPASGQLSHAATNLVRLNVKLPPPTLKGTPEDLPSGPHIEPLSASRWEAMSRVQAVDVLLSGLPRTVPFSPVAYESYDAISENPFLAAVQNPLSTFSIDVDTASYSNMRRFLHRGMLPPRDAVRIEELINYFSYDLPAPKKGEPFSVTVEVCGSPFHKGYRLARIGLKGREITQTQRPPANLVFLVDVSGSMQPENKLPLIKQSLSLLVQQLTARDSVSIVIYAGTSGLALPATPGDQRHTILAAINQLVAGGATQGSAGIQLAYGMAVQSFIEGGINRVILCTDGDFNVGITSSSELVQLIEKKAQSGVFLSVCGFGMGNLKDATMEKLADNGNGHYAYIDTLNEARKVFVEQLNGTLVTIAKDVKIQVEFNPSKAAGYRLIGYENRLLRKEDFNNDKKDAGDIGAGHMVTALYEIIPAGLENRLPKVDALKYQPAVSSLPSSENSELMTVKLRYKKPNDNVSRLLEVPVTDRNLELSQASVDSSFAAGVAAFGMILRQSEHRGGITLDTVLELAGSAKGEDDSGYRAEFMQLVKLAKSIRNAN